MKTYQTSQTTQLIYDIFISSCFGTSSSLSASPYGLKNLCKRMIPFLERVTKENLNTDKNHYQEIKNTLEGMKSSIKNDEDFEPRYMIELFRLVLLLFGDIPNNWQKNSISNSKNVNLKKHRDLVYTQSFRQKLQCIFEAHVDGRFSKNKTWQEIIAEFRKECSSDLASLDFLSWYAKNYPQFYSDLF